MKKTVLFISMLACVVAAKAAELPVWFDTFQNRQKSQSGWQTFRAATALAFEEDRSLTGGGLMKASVKFTPAVREAMLIWRFPDVQMNRFRLRVKVPKEAREVYLRMVTNDTKGDAAFFKPWTSGDALIDLPLDTADGQKLQSASPLPAGEWVTYDVTMPDDVFYEQKKQKANHPVEEFALMNAGRDSLNLSAESRPATEAFFISFVVPEDSPLFGKDLEILVDLAEIY
jgi:hypothetical protein